MQDGGHSVEAGQHTQDFQPAVRVPFETVSQNGLCLVHVLTLITEQILLCQAHP